LSIQSTNQRRKQQKHQRTKLAFIEQETIQMVHLYISKFGVSELACFSRNFFFAHPGASIAGT
jgi:hypothetical protein